MKPQVILQLEKELNTEFEKIDISEINEYKNNRFAGFSLKKGFVIGLSIMHHSLEQIPSIFKHEDLSRLEFLNLSWNNIKNIDTISNFKYLKKLDLYNNYKIEDITVLKFLTELEELDLENNNISDISPLQNLKELYYLSLRGNPIKRIENWIVDFHMDIIWYSSDISDDNSFSDGYIYFYDNPLESPPPEIIKQGKDAVRNYFEELEKGTVNLYETKLLLVGHGAVGKTSLMKRLIDDDFSENEKTTEGVDIKQWELKQKNDENLKINVWDFGGQDIYHATHQFFLSKRSLYLLIWDARIEKMMPNMASFDYWLNIVSLLSQNSPIIVVQNKIDERIKSIGETLLKRHFPNIVGFYNVSAKTGTGIPELKKVIENEIRKLPHIGEKLPKVWIDIRNQLKQTKQDFISFDDYISLCKSFNLNTEQALHLSNYFHDLGVFLHFQDNDILRNILFVKPEWATSAVYKIIDKKEIASNNGKFNSSQLSNIWHEYPQDKYPFLIELMKKFELCFLLPETKDYLVPELLPGDEPDIDWDKTDNLQFEFRYKFMPAGIITRLTVRMHDYIKNNIFWFQGALIEREQTKAIIKSDILERTIKIRLQGKNKQDLFGIIRYEIERINKTLKQPYVELMTPCICEKCKDSETPEFYAFQTLHKALEMGKKTIECRKSFEDVLINKLLGKVNGNGKQQSLFDYILLAIKQLQGLHVSLKIPEYEDSRNSFIANVLTNKNFRVKDQTQFGKSATGKNAGEIDIKIDDEKGETIAIFEAFNLKNFDRTKIKNHIIKLFNYDANGLPENYIVVYCSKNFIENWNKYIEFIPKIDYEYEMTEFTDISNNFEIPTNLKIGIARHRRNEKEVRIYHFFVELQTNE